MELSSAWTFRRIRGCEDGPTAEQTMSNEFKTDGGLFGDPPLPEKTVAASDILKQWQSEIRERDQALSKRRDNMFLGPIGIEENLSILHNDIRMNAWFIDKIIKAVAEIESNK